MHSRILHGTLPIYGARLKNMPQVPPVHTLACPAGLAPSGTWVVVGCPPKPGNVGKQNVSEKNTGWFSCQDFEVFPNHEWLKNPGNRMRTHQESRSDKVGPVGSSNFEWVNYHHPCLGIATASDHIKCLSRKIQDLHWIYCWWANFR